LKAIDNDLYNRMADTWWDEHSFLYLLKAMLNPWRVPFFKRVSVELKSQLQGMCALEIGCGGGLLSEEIAAWGVALAALDSSEPSLRTAQAHARANKLSIDYHAGLGQQLPFADETFDLVFCCDTLEHIQNWDTVIGEIARVLRPRGIFFFDTINRTLASQVLSIKIAQEWSWTRFEPPNTHVWKMFIQPEELQQSLTRRGLELKEFVGTAPKGNPLQAILWTRQYHTKKITLVEFARRVEMREGAILAGSYMGCALKP